MHIGHRHATVHGFAHVINREQSHLHSGERLHLHTGLSDGFDGGRALHAVRGFINGKFDGYARGGEGVAQRNQVTGFLRSLNACDARNAQHVAFLGVAALNQSQRGGQHGNAPRGYTDAFGVGFVGYVHHVGLTLCIKVCECGHAAIYNGLT